jgi:predicted dehydrogenase
MTREKLCIGLVGAGRIAQSYVEAMEQCEEARLVAVADVREDAARALAERAGCSSTTSYRNLPAQTRLDAVVICTPPNTHAEIAGHFLRHKVHVLCEKPLSTDLEGAREMVLTAQENGVLLTMASKFRYVEDVIRAKSIVTSGILGEIILFENAFTARVEMANRWNADPAISGGGVLIDNGTHAVDILRYFLGPLSEIQVLEGKRVQGLPVEDTVRISVRSQSGVMGNIDLSWSINKELENYISIYGSHGTVFVGWKESKYRQSSSRDWVVFGKGYDKVQAFRSNIRNFCRTILGDEKLLISSEDALASVEVIEAAYTALRQNNWISINGSGHLRPGDSSRPLAPSAVGGA